MDQPLSGPARWFFIGIVALTLGAGAVLFLFPHDTDRYFAWAIAEPMTAAFMGAAYLGGLANLLTLRADRWSVARVVVPAIFVFATAMLVATLLHASTFGWGRPVTWSWLSVYVVYPVAAPLVWISHERRWTAPEEPSDLAGWFRAAMTLSTVVFAVVGLALFVAPDALAERWPWALTTLTTRVVGGWFLEFAALSAMLSRQRSVRTAAAGLVSSAVVGTFSLAASIRLAGSFDGVVETAAFVVAAASMVVLPAAAFVRAGSAVSPSGRR